MPARRLVWMIVFLLALMGAAAASLMLTILGPTVDEPAPGVLTPLPTETVTDVDG